MHAKHKYCLQPSGDGRLRSAYSSIAQPPQDYVPHMGMLNFKQCLGIAGGWSKSVWSGFDGYDLGAKASGWNPCLMLDLRVIAVAY